MYLSLRFVSVLRRQLSQNHSKDVCGILFRRLPEYPLNYHRYLSAHERRKKIRKMKIEDVHKIILSPKHEVEFKEQDIQNFYSAFWRTRSEMTSLQRLGDKIALLIQKYVRRSGNLNFPTLENLRDSADGEEEELTPEEEIRWKAFLEELEASGRVDVPQFKGDVVTVSIFFEGLISTEMLSRRFSQSGPGDDAFYEKRRMEARIVQIWHSYFGLISSCINETAQKKAEKALANTRVMRSLGALLSDKLRRLIRIKVGKKKYGKFPSLLDLQQTACDAGEHLSGKDVELWEQLMEKLQSEGYSVDKFKRDVIVVCRYYKTNMWFPQSNRYMTESELNRILQKHSVHPN